MKRICSSLLIWITGIVAFFPSQQMFKKKLRNLNNIAFNIAATSYI